MPTRLLKQATHYLAVSKLRKTVLETFEDTVKSYLLVQNNTKQELGNKQPSIAEKSIAELVVPQLEQLCNWQGIF